MLVMSRVWLKGYTTSKKRLNLSQLSWSMPWSSKSQKGDPEFRVGPNYQAIP